jgi:glutathione S-transferase
MLHLVIGNKNYSSWSMRPWVLMKQLGIDFHEVMLKFNSTEWVSELPKWSPSRMVPVLWDAEPPSGHATWESTAIFETLAEKFPEKAIWPKDGIARNYARAVVAEMHAGFRSLRQYMPMNIRASLPGKGVNDATLKDIARIETIWKDKRARFGQMTKHPFLFGDFCAADAMFAPVVMRFRTYLPVLTAESKAYCEAVFSAPGVQQWVQGALAEHEIVPQDEPYQLGHE